MNEIFAQFIAKWTSPAYPPTRVQASDFAAVEARFGALPQTYKDAIAEYGAPYTTAALLNVIVDRQLDIDDVAEFHTPNEIASATQNWRAMGLPPDLVAFACDGSGNFFCFKPEDQPDSDAVWFFDHDLIEVYEVAPSFEEWMRQFCDL
jgi:hypothetical protein